MDTVYVSESVLNFIIVIGHRNRKVQEIHISPAKARGPKVPELWPWSSLQQESVFFLTTLPGDTLRPAAATSGTFGPITLSLVLDFEGRIRKPLHKLELIAHMPSLRYQWVSAEIETRNLALCKQSPLGRGAKHPWAP